MQDNRTTDKNENPQPDTEDWEIALDPYIRAPGAALQLALNLAALKASFTAVPFKVQEAIEGFDQALELLFLCTDFYEVSYELFTKFTEGKLTFEEGQMLNALGIKF
jgi:hypothetical protein